MHDKPLFKLMRILYIKTHPDSEVSGHQSKISFVIVLTCPSLYETTKLVSDKDSLPDLSKIGQTNGLL